jgi:hypothetical protein
VSWHIVSRMCWRRLLPNGCHRNAPVARLQGCCVIYEISKRDIVELVSAIEHRGAPVAANKALKSIKTFLRWCVGRAILDQSPAKGVPLPSKEVARDRVRLFSPLVASTTGKSAGFAPLMTRAV